MTQCLAAAGAVCDSDLEHDFESLRLSQFKEDHAAGDSAGHESDSKSPAPGPRGLAGPPAQAGAGSLTVTVTPQPQ